MSPRIPCAVVAAALLLLPGALHGQTELGGHVLYAADPAGLEAADGAFGVGARLGFRLPLAGVGAHGTFDFVFPDCETGECDLWTGAVHLTVDLQQWERFTPYGGAGVAFQKLDLEGTTLDDTGVSVVAGVRVDDLAPVTLLGEARYRIMSDFDDQVEVAVGFVF